MKKFITELRGKTVMTKDGKILGMIENFVVDTSSGQIHHVLVVPAEEIEALSDGQPGKACLTVHEHEGGPRRCCHGHRMIQRGFPFSFIDFYG
jgi:sporulation protein YlmC with PRC-barrel domain